MKTIKVRITVYYCTPNTEKEQGTDFQIFDEYQDISITEEQANYLREVEFSLNPNEEVEFTVLRQDLRDIAAQLVQPHLDYLRKQYTEIGCDTATFEQQMKNIEYSVRMMLEDDDERYHWEEGHLWVEDGILYRHTRERSNLGEITIVKCLDPKKEIVVSEIADVVGKCAFLDCRYLKEVHLPKATSIGMWAFCGCTSLREVELNDDVVIIQDGTFENCLMLREFHLPRLTVSICENAFYNCINLERLALSDDTVITNKQPHIMPPRRLSIAEDAFAFTPLDFLSRNVCYSGYNDDDEKIAEQEDEDEYQWFDDLISEFDGRLSYNDIYKKIPEALGKGQTESAMSMFEAMADVMHQTELDDGDIFVARIPHFTTASGLQIDYLALVIRDDKSPMYFTVEKDGEDYFLDLIRTNSHSTLGLTWRSNEPTMEMVAEKLRETVLKK